MANEGINSTANGFAAHAEGYATNANGVASHAEGSTNTADGDASHVEGSNNIASGVDAHAEGYYTAARGFASHAEGTQTIAQANLSHAEGGQTLASGVSSHAEGNLTVASGFAAHAEGEYAIINGVSKLTVASGEASHAEGQATSAVGEASHAEGFNTTAGVFGGGLAAHAEGVNATARAEASHAEGYATVASGYAAHAEGGTATASGQTAHAEGSGTIASGSAAHAEGFQTNASGAVSHSEGILTSTAGYTAAHIMGQSGSANESVSWFLANGGIKAKISGNTGVGTFTGGTSLGPADYAELFETADGLPIEPGYFVTFAAGTDGLIRVAGAADRYTIGVTSANPGVVGDSADFEWRGKYVRDEWGRALYRLAPAAEALVQREAGASLSPAARAGGRDGASASMGMGTGAGAVGGGEGTKAGTGTGVGGGGETMTAGTGGDAEARELQCKAEPRLWRAGEAAGVLSGEPEQLLEPMLSGEWDPQRPYVPRSERPEWIAVGLLGKLLVRDDGTCESGGCCRPGAGGIATSARSGYRVIRRTGARQVLILLK